MCSPSSVRLSQLWRLSSRRRGEFPPIKDSWVYLSNATNLEELKLHGEVGLALGTTPGSPARAKGAEV